MFTRKKEEVRWHERYDEDAVKKAESELERKHEEKLARERASRQREREERDDRERREHCERLRRSTLKIHRSNWADGRKVKLGRALADVDSDSPLFVDALGDQGRGQIVELIKKKTTIMTQSDAKEGTIILLPFLTDLNFHLFDTRGFFDLNESMHQELNNILTGRIRPSQVIAREEDAGSLPRGQAMREGYIPLKDKMHGIICILGHKDPKEYSAKMQAIRKGLKEEGYSPVGAVAFESERDFVNEEKRGRQMVKMSAAMGSPLDRTFAFVNHIATQTKISPESAISVMDILDTALVAAEGYIKVQQQRETYAKEREKHTYAASMTIRDFISQIAVDHFWDEAKVNEAVRKLEDEDIFDVARLRQFWDELQAVSEKVRQRRLLCGVLVVNAYESRLSINEEKAGIGYAVLYRALLEAAQGRVVVVIGGDDRYKDGEQDTSVLSTWAYHKIAAQFDDTNLDGRRGFVFSWDQRHNPVHEGALGSYLSAILSDKPGLEEPFKPSPPKVPPRPLPQLTTLPPSTPTDSEHNRLSELQIGPHKGQNVDVRPRNLRLSQLQAVSEDVRRRQLLCGVLVVNAYESRLSINEEKAGIGYAVLYRALLEAAQERVVVVIGGDDRYKAGEQDTSVLSTWAYHKIAAQFDDTYLDGRRGFVFSWDQRHNPVHEGALGSYLRAILSDKPGLEEPFKPSPPKVPPRPLPQLTTLPPSTPTDSEHNRLLVELAENTFDDDEARRIEEKLEKSTKQIQEEDQRRGIRFVVCCVDGKPLPEFGTFSGDFPPDLPKYMIPEILEQSANTQIAGVIVFDEGTDNTLSLRHTFCKECLEKMALASGKLTCPYRCQEYRLPANGVEGLPTSLFVNRLRDVIRARVEVRLNTPPDPALSHDYDCTCQNRSTTTSYCLDCRKDLCPVCSTTHRQPTANRRHRVVPKDSVSVAAAEHTPSRADGHSPDRVLPILSWLKEQDIMTTQDLHGNWDDVQNMVDMTNAMKQHITEALGEF
ncbi:hypothetical protein Bbelb_080790 [Branchiostoma belcheri]|nr:hypothetical protein Bbelb_080790 [Branchiostoma belcheri]